jgi:excisionase family DNA binding protein
MEDDDLLTVSEVADRLRTGTDYVYRLIKIRRLPATKLGNRYRIRVADYQAFITPKPAVAPSPRTVRDRIRQNLRSA